jgi:lipid-A-disaccharide synthase-like uncharacterized protein
VAKLSQLAKTIFKSGLKYVFWFFGFLVTFQILKYFFSKNHQICLLGPSMCSHKKIIKKKKKEKKKPGW